MTHSPIYVRPYDSNDGLQVGQMIYDTVHTINGRDYSQEQVNAWVPDPSTYANVQESYAFVADKEGTILAFGNLTSEGYLHRFYVHRDFQNQGIGNQLLKTLENKAKNLGLKEIFTEASITALPFFLKKGYLIREKQTKVLRGVSFINYKMFKNLS